ncbi:ATP-binding protein [Actimicrobium sp. CCI2.3]|uniref:ATP-binding protein n=1 Tax=Actimicrobium sp. CCI2.3 TaxID=3048616 RepID=UPI002AB32E27|nr:ATP-binding protein [Actimicrobium sp. CCI2.3]MDY7575054.1 SbcC/MukB-like Walker B domain-containing protein [Actimicrobium sp. CCI2.3]MEB0022606.1 SbcC/MukB-like Walker B domain-containing protein [Actimicrobium sp. CCI2.3]
MKLDKLILVNWGALRTQEYPMGNMTLLTGPTGSGKSTMLDALQTVMTAVYTNIFNYNPGQDETTQGARNGKTKRTLWSYIVGAEDNLFARPNGAHGYIAAVFKPSEGEEGREFTALIAASARLDGAGERRQAVAERLVLLIIDEAALQLGDLTTLAADGAMTVIAVEKIEQHLATRYRHVMNFRDSKREYLCQLYGRFRGQKTVPFAEAESAAKAWSQSIAHKPIGSVDELVRHQILELDATQLSQRIGQISKLMRQVSELRHEGERLAGNVQRLALLGKIASATSAAHEAAVQGQLLVSTLALRDDRQQLTSADLAVQATLGAIDIENASIDQLEQERLGKQRSLTQLQAQMMGIPAAEQKRRLQQDVQANAARIHSALAALKQNLLAAQQLERTALLVGGMQIPLGYFELVKAARHVAVALSAAGGPDWTMQLQSIAQLSASAEIDVLKALLLMQELAGIELPLLGLHDALVGTGQSFAAALHAQIAQLRAIETDALKREKESASRKANLAEGGADYPASTRHALKAFREELGAARAQVLCDLIEPLSPQWQPAIEGYLGGARFNLVVDQEWEARAIEFVRHRKLRASVIQGSLCLKHMRPDRTPADSIIHELHAEHPIADAYLHEQFGQVVKVADAHALRQVARGLTQDGKGSGGRTMFAADAEQLVFGQEAKRLARERAGQDHADAEAALDQVRAELRDFQGALALMVPLQRVSLAGLVELDGAVRSTDALRQDLARIDLSEVSKLEDEVEVLQQELRRLDERKSGCDKQIGGLERTLQAHQLTINKLALGMEPKQERADQDRAALRDLCIANGSLSLTALADAVALEAGSGTLTPNEAASRVKQYELRTWRLHGDMRDALGDYHAHARPDERFDVSEQPDEREGDFGRLYARIVALSAQVREQLLRQQEIGLVRNLDQLRTAEASFNDVFTKQFCYEIRNAVDTGVRTLKTLNTELDKLKFGTDTFRIDWSEWVPEFKEYYDFFSATAALSETQESLGLFDETPLSDANCAVRDRLLALLLSDEGERALNQLQRVADYRNYRRYEIFKESESGSQVRLSEWGTGSGGQLETPAYIIHAAVVTNRLRHFDKGSNLKLLVNDESFSKMDEGRARDVLKFLRDNLGMQLICALPTKHAGAIKPEFSREWSFSRTEAEDNGEVGFVSEADERTLRTDPLRGLWEERRAQVREQAMLVFGQG